MRTKLQLVLVALLVLFVASIAHADLDSDMAVLKDQIKAVTDQVAGMVKRLESLEAQRAARAGRVGQAGRPAPTPAAPAAKPWYEKIAVTGYAQNRFEARKAGGSDFSMRRLYLTFAGKVTPQATTVLSFQRVGPNDPQIDLYLAMVDYAFNSQWSAQIGQVGNNFGIDAAESSSLRIPIDRSVLAEGIAGRAGVGNLARPGISGFFFAGPSDRGLYVTRKPGSPWEPKAILGVVNGNFNGADDNSNKTVSADLKWDRPWGFWGASWLNGRYGPAGADKPRRALNLFVRKVPAPWGFQAEWARGALMGKDVLGWYGQVAYKDGRGMPYFRYERFDPDRCTDGDAFYGWHLGYAFQVDKDNKVSAELLKARGTPLGAPASVDYSQVGVQWQVGF